MNCPNCHQVTEAGAAFCGNCGQALQALPVLSPASVPAYAVALPSQHRGETKALLALLFGVIGIVGVLFLALLGLGFGIAGIVMGTMSRSGTKRGLSTAGLVFSSLAIVGSLAAVAYTLKQDPGSQKSQAAAAQGTTPTVTASDLSTPCYSVGFVDTFNVSHSSGSCNMNAYNGTTLDTSTNAYKVYANQTDVINASAFGAIAKQAIEKDVKASLPGFGIDTEQAAVFAGSPAYFVHVSDKAQGVAVVEAAVFHVTASGNNVFVLVHATTGKVADLNTLEAQWQWK
jgi:hypothetical protein